MVLETQQPPADCTFSGFDGSTSVDIRPQGNVSFVRSTFDGNTLSEEFGKQPALISAQAQDNQAASVMLQDYTFINNAAPYYVSSLNFTGSTQAVKFYSDPVLPVREGTQVVLDDGNRVFSYEDGTSLPVMSVPSPSPFLTSTDPWLLEQKEVLQPRD